ncbi:MAG: 30S ribosomal protein S4 [Chloroflexi bacterium]|nr:30S ribosomal protein S4 [Chloroflexota bacterium]
MARYIGPACKLCRRFGEKLGLRARCWGPKCALERRPGPPGQHAVRRRKLSERGLQLREKQKARYSYGLLERQFRRYFQRAMQRAGITGENLLQLLELRLDNVVYRLGFAGSRRQARQWVRHGFITVNGRVTNIPSFEVKVGNVIAWKEGSSNLEYYQMMAEEIKNKAVPSWLELDMENLRGRVLAFPAREDIEVTIDEHEIVAYYSR